MLKKLKWIWKFILFYPQSKSSKRWYKTSRKHEIFAKKIWIKMIKLHIYINWSINENIFEISPLNFFINSRNYEITFVEVVISYVRLTRTAFCSY